MQIRSKVILIFLLLSLLPFVIIGTIAYKNGESIIRKTLGLAFQQTAHESIDRVDRLLYEVYRNVHTWADLELMQEVVTGDLDGKISSFLMGVSSEHTYFDSINILDFQRKIVASSIPSLIDRIISNSYSYENAVNGKKYIEDVHLDEMSKKWVVTFSFPITAKFGKDKIIGVLCASWRADELNAVTQIYEKEKRGIDYDHIRLIRKDGLLISAPEVEKKDIFSRDLAKTELGRILLAKQKTGGYVVTLDQHNIKSLFGYSYSKGYSDFSGLGWIALVEQDARKVFAPVQKFRIIVSAVGFIVFLLVIISSFILTQKITEPILKISQLSMRVAQGDFEGRISRFSNDEIGILGESFNKMTLNLETSIGNLNKEIAERKKVESELKEAYANFKNAQDQLIQSEKFNAAGRLASGVAHEVKNPLGIIKQGAEYLEGKLLPSEKAAPGVLRMIQDNIKRADTIIRALLDFSKVSKLEKRPEDINSILESSLVLIQHSPMLENIKIIRELGKDLPVVSVDKGKMEQVFINILLNAVQAMPGGGDLFLRTYRARLGELKNDMKVSGEDYSKQGEEVLMIEIEDTGAGITGEDLKKVFDPFFTTKEPGQGTGLGLSVSKNILAMHKGLIEIQSSEGKGAKVIITLKIAGGGGNG